MFTNKIHSYISANK